MSARNVAYIETVRLYEVVALMTIGACAWFIGQYFGVFDRVATFAYAHGLIHVFVLVACICLGAIAAVIRSSLQLRQEIAARLKAEALAEQTARQDQLTGLGNRRYFYEQLESMLAARKPGETFALMLIDLDRFKPVNDIYGHAAGNAVLCAVASRLRRVVPEAAIVARLGGDEFVALIPDLKVEPALSDLAERMIAAVRERIPWRQIHLEVDATIGVAFAEPGATDPDALLHAADLAMYQGKRDGRGVWRFFREDMDRELKARAQLESDLRAALAAGQVQPYYQPIVALPSRELVGFEVLARWAHPTLGEIEPQKFISIAEESGMIGELFIRILKAACLDAKTWPGRLTLSVNAAPRQFQDAHMPEKVLAVLTKTGFPAERLEIEITESALIRDLDAARVALASLQSLGVKIALDDFGAGYSTLCHLSELRFNKLKIDRSYVTSLRQGSERAKLVEAILRLGSSLSLQTTAEGIETPENLDWLSSQGCSYGQGYLFGRAMTRRDADELVRMEQTAGGFPRGERKITLVNGGR